MADVQVYEFTSYRAFLKAWLEARAGRPSLRSLASRLDCSASLLSGIVNGQRDLDEARAETLGRLLEMDPDQRRYFMDLVVFEQSTSRSRRRMALDRILATQNFREARRVAASTWRLFSTWRVPAVAELAQCAGFKAEPAWIARQLRPTITEAEAAEALADLEGLGLLVRDEEGRLLGGSESWATEHEVDQNIVATALHELHKQGMDRALDALERDPHTERQFGVVTAAIPAGELEALKDMVAHFQEAFMQRCEGAAGERTQVYQLNMQLFALSEPTG